MITNILYFLDSRDRGNSSDRGDSRERGAQMIVMVCQDCGKPSVVIQEAFTSLLSQVCKESSSVTKRLQHLQERYYFHYCPLCHYCLLCH